MARFEDKPGENVLNPTKWEIERIINFDLDHCWESMFSHLGFHGRSGQQFVLGHYNNWIGEIDGPGTLKWTAGAEPVVGSERHINVNLPSPLYISEAPDGAILVSCYRDSNIYKIDPGKGTANLFINGNKLGFKDIGNCIFDQNDNIWVNEVFGCQIWQFDLEGNPLMTLGGEPCFQSEDVPLEEAQFSNIFDIRPGPDGNIYILDAGNFAVRMIDLSNGKVSLIAGTGLSGYSGDDGDARLATFGHTAGEPLDGPLSISLDENCNIFIGDTQNHAVRMVDRTTGIISTIAGDTTTQYDTRNDQSEKDPFKLNLQKINSMDYYDGHLFIPKAKGDLIIMVKQRSK